MTRRMRAAACALMTAVLALGAAANAQAFEFRASWGYAYIDDHPFRDPDSGALLPAAQAWPRGYIRDVPPLDDRDVRITVWAFDANSDPIRTPTAPYSVTEGDFQNVTFDRLLLVPGVRYLRFDFCRFYPPGGSDHDCLPSHYLGQPPPEQPGDEPDPPGGGAPPGDADHDGHKAPADCDDTNSRVHPGRPELAGNGIDDDCAGGDRAGKLTGEVQTAWRLNRRRTRVARLRVVEAAPGSAVDVTCHGGGCPFKARSFGVDATGTVGLTRLFERRLRARAVIQVSITAPNAIGKVLRYRMRRERLPKSRRMCLPPGATEPAGC